MSLSIRQDFHSDLASILATDIQYSRANYFYFLGKVESWGPGDLAPTIAETDSDFENTNIRTNSLFMKKILPGDISLVIPRYDWVTGLIWDVWDHTKNLINSEFYCVSSAFNVYKCLSNNGGEYSTVEPTGQSLGVITTADGYVWKFMYSIPAVKQSRFMTPAYMPVQKALSNNFYSKGAVEEVSVIEGGSGYTGNQLTTIIVAGSTTGTGATGTLVVDAFGTITSVNLTGGSGYTQGVNYSIATSAGVGGALVPVIVGGVVTGMTITTGGLGYANGEVVTFTVGGAVIVPEINAVGTIAKLKIVNPGIGYTGTPTLTVSTPSTGSGKYGNPTALCACTAHNGSIREAWSIDPGINYPKGSATVITVSGDGTGAAFTPVIYNGSVIDVIVDSPGENYTVMRLTITGTGTGAVITPIIAVSDYTSRQSVVEQTTVKGAIYHAQIINGGNNYTASATVSVIGDGTGCTATATVSLGAITKITITNPGVNYTTASLIVTDPNRTLVGTVVDVSAYPVLSPLNGHGYDAVTELNGRTLALNSSLRQENALNTLLQDYRQFGIIKNPLTSLTGNLFNETTALITYRVQFQGVADLNIDEVLVFTNTRFRVVAINGTVVSLQLMSSRYVAPIGLLQAEAEQTRSYTGVRVISSPTVNKYSGKLLYVANENPFSFTADQGIVIKTFLKF